jgi:hypothetical protein
MTIHRAESLVKMVSPKRKKTCSSSRVSPSSKDVLILHGRLVSGDPTAPNDLAELFLTPLVDWLQERNPKVSSDFILQAVEDALLNLIHHPSTYKPEKKLSLEKYLRMSAQGDLRNTLAKVRRSRAPEVSWNIVELSDQHGKYLGKEDDPSLPLQVAEEAEELRQSIPATIREGLTEAELQVLDLMLQGERRTSRLAEAYGIADLDPAKWAREIKRVKDKLKKRLERKRKKE